MSVEQTQRPMATSGAPSDAPRRRRRRIDGWALVAAVPLVFLLVFFVFPLGQMFGLSGTDFLSASESGADNYRWYLGSDVQLTILKRTFMSAGLVTLICLALGFPYAYLMTIVSRRWRIFLLGAVLAPFWTSLIVRTYAWIVLLQDSGPVVGALHKLGFDSVRILSTTSAVVIGMTQIMLPFMILPLYSNLSRIDRRLLLAAQSLGASPRSAFWKVYVPLSVPGVVAGSTIVGVLSLGFYFTPALLGSQQNSMISQQIVEQVSRLLAFGRGSTMAVVLLVVTLALMAISAVLVRPLTRALGTGR